MLKAPHKRTSTNGLVTTSGGLSARVAAAAETQVIPRDHRFNPDGEAPQELGARVMTNLPHETGTTTWLVSTGEALVAQFARAEPAATRRSGANRSMPHRLVRPRE
jgi:hypothetical protein